MIDALISIIDSIGPTCSAVAAIVCCVALKQADANTKLIKHMDAKLSANDLAILRSKIKERADGCIDRGYITEEELAELDGLYDRYYSMGGNSFIRTLMDKISKLEVKNG